MAHIRGSLREDEITFREILNLILVIFSGLASGIISAATSLDSSASLDIKRRISLAHGQRSRERLITGNEGLGRIVARKVACGSGCRQKNNDEKHNTYRIDDVSWELNALSKFQTRDSGEMHNY